MREILIACGDVEQLRGIIAELPPNEYKPIATKRGAGIAAKINGRGVAVAIVHETLEDGSTAQLLQELQQLQPEPPQVLLLTAGAPPTQGPFATALKYPMPGPVFRAALNRLAGAGQQGQDLERWRAFYNELQTRNAEAATQNYFRVLRLPEGAPHHNVVKAFDALSLRYHPDRYSQFRHERWGAVVFDEANKLYKLITEAYSVLSDRKLRARYEQAMARGELRLDPAEVDAASGPKSLEELSANPAAKKFLRLAQTSVAARDWANAIQNLKFAQSMEPGNTAIAEKIVEIEQKAQG